MIKTRPERKNSMHTCAAPKDDLKEKFEENATVKGGLGHTLLEQIEADDGTLAEALKEYFESAHLDARITFHKFIGIDLHPDDDGNATSVTYPGSLPSTTRRGLFGEVLAGLLTESYEYIGAHSWDVPIFLLRFHDDAVNYLFTLARDPTQTRQTIGRLGTDFIGVSLNDDGEVVRIICGEAKWRRTLTQAKVDDVLLGKKVKGSTVRSGKGVWRDLNNEPNPPSGARQLLELLREYDADGFDSAILCLERALVAKNPVPIPKTDLIVFAGNGRAKREKCECLLPWKAVPNEYTAGNDLQIVEVVLKSGEYLIDTIYASLWEEGEDA